MSRDETENKVKLLEIRKKKTWIKFYPERWIFGSSREEMSNAERAVWMDFLALAALNDPPGQVQFLSYKRLAHQLNISVKLLKSTISKALAYGKIDVKETPFGQNLDEVKQKVDKDFQEKKQNLSQNSAQLGSKLVSFDTDRSKIGLTLRTIKILKWNEYQNEYWRQKPHREKKKMKKELDQEEDEKLQNPGKKTVTQVTDRGEERRREEIREDKRRRNFLNKEPLNSPLPSTPKEGISIKDEFLEMLRSLRGYPFDEIKDSLLFDITIKDYPGINIMRQLKRKVNWWKDHPDALKANPRKQLQNFFKEEAEFKKRGGPQKVGEILKELEDQDHRAWIKRGLLGDSKEKAE